MSLKDFKTVFDPLLLSFIDKKIKSFQIYKNKDLNLYLAQLKNLLKEGKRIRPYIAFLAYKAYGGKEDLKSIKYFVFLEIFHAFCIVHDDVMDKSELRHGRKTINKFASDLSHDSHFGDSVAILLGDYLIAWAFEILSDNTDFEDGIISKIGSIFLEMADEVITGQFIDVTMTISKRIEDGLIEQKMLLKTAGYSFIRPMMIGKQLSGKNKVSPFPQDFGKHLGLSYQLQDDLLDITHNSSQASKTSFNDVSQRLHTIFSNYVLKNGNSKQKTILTNLFGKKLSESDKQNLRKVFIDSGAVQFGKEKIEEHISIARKILEKESFAPNHKKEFYELIETINNRRS